MVSHSPPPAPLSTYQQHLQSQPASPLAAGLAPNIASAEKDTDDLTAPSRPRCLHEREHSSTPTRLNRLFASPPSPISSREPSFGSHHGAAHAASSRAYVRSMNTDVAPLHAHLYSRGLVSGKHSDITVKAFGTSYALHRIILDRAPFFTSALSPPWLEASAKEVTLHPEDTDPNITREAFEAALAHLYGHDAPAHDQINQCALLATASWLEMQDMVSTCTENILKSMHPRNLGPTVQFVDHSYYGKAGDKILASAKAMLCRDGWTVPPQYWDSVPCDVVREIVGGDSFYIPNEWARFQLTRRILNRKLRAFATDAGLPLTAPKPLQSKAIRIRRLRAKSAIGSRCVSAMEDAMTDLSLDLDEPHVQDWLNIYSHPDVESLTLLLDEGIYYTHLGFEHLQELRSARDVLGVPIVPEDIVSAALWKSVELRQRVINAQESDEELGLTQYACHADSESEMDRREPDAHDPSPRRFWIPATDCNITVGGASDPIVTASASGGPHKSTNQEERPMGPPEAVQWFSDFIKERNQAPNVSRFTNYSTLPPFRFAAEFPNPRTLKDKRRVYSQTIFYAGSYWNVYVQKVKSGSRNPQLGVYLHRARGIDPEEPVHSGSGARHTVDDRIGALEREMNRRQQRTPTHARQRSAEDTVPGTEGDAVLVAARTLHSRGSHPSQDSIDSTNIPSPRFRPSSSIPALPPYTDSRPKIRTYFKIYSPSKGGRMLSVYESAPDCFNFSQSWGWKSSTLMVDDGLAPATAPSLFDDFDSDDHGFCGDGGYDDCDSLDEGRETSPPAVKADGRLRFMIVLGVV